MKYKDLHDWEISPKEAIRLQFELFKRIKSAKCPLGRLHSVAGVDVSVKDNVSQAAIVILSYPRLEIIESITASGKTSFPYIPGLLSFREAPVILKCVKKLKKEPDLFIFDGQGMAHPRKMGIATHMGIILDKPSIGSAKSRLCGKFSAPGEKKGDYSLMKDK
ncbi:MAG: endonuclease V, partial [Candidatus Omnitrophica bacterium]|nr:endonuclease V [Candidatus Omnitrophota bacterium]